MEKKQYVKPLVEAAKIETELFFCVSGGGMDIDKSGDENKKVQESTQVLSNEHGSFDLWED